MRKHHTLIFVVCVLLSSCTTRYYLVRHAEKACEDCLTCGLSLEGSERAIALAHVLAKEGIDTVFASHCLRTQETALPLTELLNKSVSIYHTDHLNSFIQHLKDFDDSRSILIVSHSNLVPVIIDSLAHQPVTIASDDFDNLYIITKKTFPFRSVRLEKHTYGEVTP